MRTTIRSAYQQGTPTTPAPALEKCPTCGAPKTLSDSVDTMIQNAQNFAGKPHGITPPLPDRPSPAAADDSRVMSVPPGRRSRVTADPRLAADLQSANRNLKKRY